MGLLSVWSGGCAKVPLPGFGAGATEQVAGQVTWHGLGMDGGQGVAERVWVWVSSLCNASSERGSLVCCWSAGTPTRSPCCTQTAQKAKSHLCNRATPPPNPAPTARQCVGHAVSPQRAYMCTNDAWNCSAQLDGGVHLTFNSVHADGGLHHQVSNGFVVISALSHERCMLPAPGRTPHTY